MNCETFNSLVGRHAHGENASGEFIYDRDRVAFSAHAKSCADCAATLAADEQLAGALKSMRHATRNTSAPAHLETILREKFRRHSAAASRNVSAKQAEILNLHGVSRDEVLSAAMHTNNENKFAPASRATRNAQQNSLSVGSTPMWRNPVGWLPSAPRAAAFISAMLLFAVALVVAVRHDSNPNDASLQLTTNRVNFVDDTALPIVTERATDIATAVESNASGLHERASSHSPAPSAVMPVSLSSISKRKPNDAKRAGEIQLHRGRARIKSRANNQPDPGTSPEIATAFLPLVEAQSLAEIDSGHIMRVEMPREALVSFGLPMNQERAGELVKADVLLGDDGVARAIRFVR